jgi:glucuronate isomerase
MSRYQGMFSSWADVQEQFGTHDKEPTEVILAAYDEEGYDGSALVIFRRGRRYFTNYGSHCSCHGLEGQWDPIQTTKRELKKFYRRVVAQEEPAYGINARHANTILENLN